MTDTPNVTIDVALAQTTQLDAKPNFKRKAHMSTDEVIELEKQRKEFVKERKRMRYGNDVNVNPDREKVDRVPKRRVALLMGYCGSGYRGMQFNQGTRTIEGDLWDALVKAECVSELNADDPKKVSFNRAARTDKGVHALGQVCSLMLQRVEKFDTPDGPALERALVKQLNDLLPAQIRIWGILRMPKSFQAKNSCDSRWYEYVMPTYLFANPPKGFYPNANLDEQGDPHYPFPNPDELPDKQEKRDERVKFFSVPGVTAEQVDKLKQFRMTPEQLEKLRAGIAKFKGTHNFFNYTLNKRFEEANSKRHLIQLEVSDPFVRDGQEWVSIRLWGQSFMLHQIRKMIGMIAMIIRTNTSLDVMDVAFTKVRFNIPKAPAVGLLLDRVVYRGFNDKLTKINRDRVANLKRQGVDGSQLETAITFDAYKQEMLEFRDAFVYPKVFAEDAKDNIFVDWMRSVDAHGPEYSWFLRADGQVKEEDRPSYIFVHKEARDESDNEPDD